MKIYNKEGYPDWVHIYTTAEPFTMIVSARGVGKTYGLLKYVIENRIKFLYVRRLKVQIDISCTRAANPFNALNNDGVCDVAPYRDSGGIVSFFEEDYNVNKEKNEPVGDAVGYAVDLSTIQNMRGMSFDNIECIIFDEFIANAGEKPIKNEFGALLNLYETVNRNRELQGKLPVKCFMLGNANKLNNVYFSEWHLTGIALRMIRGKQFVYTRPGLKLYILQDSPISAKKAKTGLYQVANNDFIQMALNSEFRTDETNIKSYNLNELKYECSIGELGIYRIRANNHYYISSLARKARYYKSYGYDLNKWNYDYWGMATRYTEGKLVFESYDCELIFREYLNLNY